VETRSPAPLDLSARSKLALAAFTALGAAFFGALWWFHTSGARWLVFGVFILFTSWSLEFAALALPESKAKKHIAWIVGVPAAAMMMLLRLGGAVYSVFFALLLWGFGILFPLAIISSYLLPQITTPAPVVFVS